MKSVRFADQRIVKKRSRLWKWIKRIAFFILLWLLFLEFNHFTLAIESLRNVNADQINIINDLAHKVHNLELSNANLQIQADMMKVKINGLDVIHNVSQQPAIHNIQTETVPQANIVDTISNSLHNGISDATTQAAVLTTTVIAVFGVLKSMASFIPILP